MVLSLLNILFHVLHLIVIGINLFGWIPRSTRVLHRWCVGITAACWLVIGPAMSGTLGYCPLTEWHWNVKTRMGETDLPSSYIDFLFREAGLILPHATVDKIVAVTFGTVAMITILLFLIEKKHKR